MSAQSATYSFVDTSGVLTNPALPAPVVFAGQIGMGSFTIIMHTERTQHDVAADGTVMPSAIAGDNGEITIEVQQTSLLNQLLLNLYNTLLAAFYNGDVTNWAATSISLRNIVSASQHLLSGVSFSKIPDKPYHAQGSKIVWRLMACSIQNL